MLSTSPRLDHLLKRIPVTAIPPIHSIAARMTKYRSFTIPAKRSRYGTGSRPTSKRTAAIPRFLTRIRASLPGTTDGKHTRIRQRNLLQDNILCGDGLLASTIEIYMPIVESSRANSRIKKVRNRQLSHKILKLNWLHVKFFFLLARLLNMASFSQKKIPQFDRFTEPPT